jgi:hypothetical protein
MELLTNTAASRLTYISIPIENVFSATVLSIIVCFAIIVLQPPLRTTIYRTLACRQNAEHQRPGIKR